MPELPEVETVRRGLERWAAGRTIETVEIFGPRTLRRHQAGVADFVARVSGCRIEAACRRGKYLWLPLGDPHPRSGERGWGPATSGEAAGDIGPATSGEAAGDIGPATSGEAVIAHLGMSGQFLAVPSMTPGQAHLRARFRFVDGDPEIRFVDQRTFGGLALDVLPEDGGLPARIAHIAPDPLEAAFDPEAFYRAIRRRRTGVKRALLDQSLVSGIGNIYADEALWRARMHYARGTDTLRRRDAEALVDAVRAVLEAAITAGGTSFDALYVAVNGESGYFDRSLEVYGREGEPCSRCGAAIVREHFMNRSSYRCPRCQRTPRHPRW